MKETTTKIPEQNKQSDLTWLDNEAKELALNTPTGNFDKLPTLKLEENKIVEVEITFDLPFQKWNTTNQKGQQITKAIIPVTHDGEKKNFWLNQSNPLYKDIIHAGRNGQQKFKILQTGQQANTRYILLVK